MGKRPEPVGRGERIEVSQHPGHQQGASWRDGWLTGQAPGNRDRAARGQEALPRLGRFRPALPPGCRSSPPPGSQGRKRSWPGPRSPRTGPAATGPSAAGPSARIGSSSAPGGSSNPGSMPCTGARGPAVSCFRRLAVLRARRRGGRGVSRRARESSNRRWSAVHQSSPKRGSLASSRARSLRRLTAHLALPRGRPGRRMPRRRGIR